MSSDPRLMALCAELERQFELEELKELARDLLGLDPEEIGGGSATGSFVKALTKRCLDTNCVEALCDAVAASREHVAPQLSELRRHGFTADDSFEAGQSLGPYMVLRRLGRGRLGTVYLARRDGEDIRLKVLNRHAALDPVGLQRFLTANRIIGTLGDPGLPRDVSAGQLDGRYYVAQRYVDGQTLASRLSKTGAMHIEEARGLMRRILEPLATLHRRQIAHGDLRPENVLIGAEDEGADGVVLLDPGSHFLTVRPPVANGRSDRMASLGSERTLSPEQIEGRLADERSDVYSFGALLFELLTGNPPFKGTSTAMAFMAHLTQDPPLASTVAPAGWIGPDLDDFIGELLNKVADRRPKNADALLEQVDGLGRMPAEPQIIMPDEELDERIAALFEAPEDELAEEALFAAVREGGDIRKIADAFRDVAGTIDLSIDPFRRSARYRLTARAARLYDTNLKDPTAAEPLYAELAELEPDDMETLAALERLRRQLGKHEEIVEMLLARVERTETHDDRARFLSDIGRLYATDMGDQEQALVAYAQAFCEDPRGGHYAREIEMIAGKNQDAWNEVLASCVEATNGDLALPDKNALFLQMGRWYLNYLSRPDLALSCFSAVLATEPNQADALEGLAELYRKSGQWNELGQVLLARAESPSTSAPVARELRAEAAEVFALRLNNIEGARQLYERVLEEDPSHEAACDALAQIYEHMQDFGSFVRVLEARAQALDGPERRDALFRIGEVYEVHLDDPVEAVRRYRSVINEDPLHLPALQGMDRCLSRLGKFEDLVDNLHMQIAAAATPRQKIQLWERVAAIWDEEFIDHARAAEAWENVLDLDGEHDNALTEIARHYRVLERWNDVVFTYERHLSLLDGDPPRYVEKALQLGRVFAEHLKLPERAIAVYEAVLERDSTNSVALEALAGLRVTTGEMHQALQALESLARKAATPQERAEHYLRAAQLLEKSGDQDGAIERYKLAVDANPQDRTAATILRAAYVARGDDNAAAELLEQEIRNTAGEVPRAKLAAEMSALCRDRLKDDARAESWAKVALDIDPTSLDALRVLGDIAFSAQRYVEAARYYDQVANRTDALTQPEAIRILTNYATCLEKNGKVDRAIQVGEKLLSIAPEDMTVLSAVAERVFEQGDSKRSFDLHWELLHRARQELDEPTRARVLYRMGESARRAGDLNAAFDPLKQASEIDPTWNDPLRALAQLHGAKQQWEQAIQTMYRQLENETGEARIKLLLEIGDLAAQQLKDPSYAAKSYLFALSEKPNDRRILTKLMQLYSEEKDWDRLVKVVLKLADFVDDTKQKSKYLHTAARVAHKEMGDAGRASQLMQRALELDPDNGSLIEEGLEIHQTAHNWEALKELLKRRIKIANDAGDAPRMVQSLTALAELYLNHFKRLEQAIAVYEGAQEVDPENVERKELLAHLYATHSGQYLDKAITAQHEIIERDPFRPEAHKILRRLYTEAKRPDPAWCCCQTLYVLGQADRDEEGFFLRMRSEEGAAPKARLTESDFHSTVVHPKAEPLLTALFTVIQPAIVPTRATTAQQAGYGRDQVVDPTQHQFAAAQTIPYVADIMGMQCPPMLQNANDLGELSFLHTQPPAIVLGTSVVGVALPPQTALFMAARHLTFYKQGLYIRQLVPTTGALKAWLFAAIAIMKPDFPIPADIHKPAQDAARALQGTLVGPQRDHLARIVGKLLQDASALDLKKWVTAIDLTADRAGLLFSDDLQTAVELIRASDPRSSAIGPDERVEEIYRYAVSEQYFEARQKLRISIDS